jgi:hypothetical protein
LKIRNGWATSTLLELKTLIVQVHDQFSVGETICNRLMMKICKYHELPSVGPVGSAEPTEFRDTAIDSAVPSNKIL